MLLNTIFLLNLVRKLKVNLIIIFQFFLLFIFIISINTWEFVKIKKLRTYIKKFLKRNFLTPKLNLKLEIFLRKIYSDLLK